MTCNFSVLKLKDFSGSQAVTYTL